METSPATRFDTNMTFNKKKTWTVILLVTISILLFSFTFSEKNSWNKCSKCNALQYESDYSWLGITIGKRIVNWADMDEGACQHQYGLFSSSTSRGPCILFVKLCSPRSMSIYMQDNTKKDSN